MDGWVYEGREGGGREGRRRWGGGAWELLWEVKEGLDHLFGATCGSYCCCCPLEEKSLVVGHPDAIVAAAAQATFSCPLQDLKGRGRGEDETPSITLRKEGMRI